MEGEKLRITQRVAQAAAEGHDNLGTFELTLGGAILVGYLFLALLNRVTTLASLAFWALFIGGLWYGSVLEYHQLRALGRRRFRGTLLLLITWITVGLALLLGGLLLALAHLRGAGDLVTWHDGPILLTFTLGFYHLSQEIGRAHV